MKRAFLFLALFTTLAWACKKKPAATTPLASSTPSPAPLPTGMVDPFARLSSEQARSMERAYKAEHAKSWGEALAAFKDVSTALPDYSPARWGSVRALVGAGQFADAVLAFEELLSRDFVAYRDSLDRKKELAPLRAAPEWAAITALKDVWQKRYAAGLDHGFFFVARTRREGEPKIDATKNLAKYDLRQEVFHFDPATRRFRRVTDTGGRVYAINVAPDGKTVAFVCANKVQRDSGVGSLVDPEMGAVSVDTLTTTGPFVMKGPFLGVELGFDADGHANFSFKDAEQRWGARYTFDSANTALAPTSTVAVGAVTRATPSEVTHATSGLPTGIKLADGASTFSLNSDGNSVSTPVVAARPVDPASLEWSPKKTRLTYAGKIDVCALQGETPEKKKAGRNELFVFDVAQKSAQRIAAAISLFETRWLDDDHLVYDGGVGKDGQVHLYGFSSHDDKALATPAGAGLYGVPHLDCDQQAAPDTDDIEPVDPDDAD